MQNKSKWTFVTLLKCTVHFPLSHGRDVTDLSFFLQEIKQQSSELPCKFAKLPENRSRNRYRDVSPCMEKTFSEIDTGFIGFC